MTGSARSSPLKAGTRNALLGSPTEFRAAVDQRLFGLGPERYEQLLTLILTLRRPQLAKNLDPVKLSDTLTDGLRPVDDDLIAEAARSFDDMEVVALTLEGLAAADEATRTFLASYTTYLRTHARWAADALTRRREAATAARGTVAADEQAQQAAEDAAQAAMARREAAESAVAGLRARTEQLRASRTYQAVEQTEDLERLVRTCLHTTTEASAELTRRRAAASRSHDELGRASQVLAAMQAAVSRAAAELATHVGEAGIWWQPADASRDGLAERAGARAAVRLEAVRAVRAALAEHHKAEQARNLARLALDRAVAALAAADQAEQAAADAVQQAVADAHGAPVTWAVRHAGLLPEPQRRLLTGALRDAVERFGEPDAPALETVYNAVTAAAEQRVRDEQAALRAERGTTSAERDRVAAERDRIAAERDDAPPPYPGRTADREIQAGAPLWRLVRFANHVPDVLAAAIEAARQATGMLDAWITPAPDEVTADDGFLFPGTAVPGASLADVLEPEVGTPVPAGRVTAVLGSIALDGELFSATAVIGADGRYSHGVTAGRHRKEHAEYIGATARARRRAARIAECEAKIAELDARLATLDRQIIGLADTLAAFADARAALPPTRAIATAQREHSRAARQLRGARENAEQAQAGFDESVAAYTVTERVVRRVAVEHSLDPDSVDRVEAAAQVRVGRRQPCRPAPGGGPPGGRRGRGGSQAGTRGARGSACRGRRARGTAAAHRGSRQAGCVAWGCRPAGAGSGADRGRSGRTGRGAGRREDRPRRGDRRDPGCGSGGRARGQGPGGPGRRRWGGASDRPGPRAVRRPGTARRAELSARTGLAGDRSRLAAGRPARGGARGVRGDSRVTRDLTPTDTSLKISTTRLTRALEELQAQLAAAGQDYHPEWDGADGVIVVRIADEQGPLPAGAFAARIAAARRDQQLLLSESEQRILEDALLTRLAQQIHDRTVDARDLIRSMNTEMRSRKMSSGKTVGVKWQLADHLDDEQRAVCSLLDAGASRLGPDALSRMRSHFAAQIKTARPAP